MLANKYVRKVIIILLIFSVQGLAVAAYTVEMSKQQVQDAVERYFPIKHTTPFVKLTFYQPVVFLDQKTNRIGLEVSVTADLPGLMIGKGQAAVNGDLEYRKETGEFYLHDPKITRLDIHDLPAETAAPIQQAVQELMQQSLPVILVYKLRDEDFGQRMTKSVLSTVVVHNGMLVLELTIPGFN